MSRGSSSRDIAFDPSSGQRLPSFVSTVNAFPGVAINVSDTHVTNTSATGEFCFALGELAEAGGVVDNISIGYNSSNGSADASYEGSVSIGSGSAVDGRSCFALGRDATVAAGKTQASAIGRNAQALGDRSFACGFNATANFDYSLAVGTDAVANAIQAAAVGYAVDTEGVHVGNSITSTGDCVGINVASAGADIIAIGDNSATPWTTASSVALIVDAYPALYVDALGCRTESLITPTRDRLGTYGDADPVPATDFRDGTRIFYADVVGTLLTPTAAEVIAAHPGAIDDDSFSIIVTTLANDVDWVPGAGVTIDMGTTGYVSGRNFGGQTTRYLCVLDVTNATMTMYFMFATA